MSNSTEIYLVNVRLKEGDHQAFLELYNLYSKPLYHFIKKYIQDGDTIDDIVHDTFLNLWKSREKISHKYPLQGYIFRIARNIVFQHIKQKIRATDVLDEWTAVEKMKKEPSVEYGLIHEEYDEIYDTAIERLPPQRKKIFIMSREEGLSHREIATFLEISPNTVKEHMSLAIKSIRDYITKEHDIILKFAVLSFTLLAQ